MNTLKTLILTLVFGSVFCLQTSVSAEEFTLHIDDLSGCNNFGMAVPANADAPVDFFNLTYNDVTQEFEIQVSASANSATGEKLVKVVHGVITEGPMPQGEGSRAHFYFDGTNVNNPKFAIYAYNARAGVGIDENPTDNVVDEHYCNNDQGSWFQAGRANFTPFWQPDDVISSVSHPNEFSVLNATESTSGTTTTRVYTAKFSASLVNSHDAVADNNKTTYQYEGLKFGEKVGVWLWFAADATTTFDAQGFLTNFNTDNATCAMCDQVDFESKEKPICSNVTVSANPVFVGKSTTITYEVTDPDFADQSEATITVSYTGAPSNAKITPADGEIVEIDPATGKGIVTIDWQPTEAEANKKHTIGAVFQKNYGLGNLVNAPGDCQVDVTVEPQVPECRSGNPEPLGIADGNTNCIKIIANELDRRTKNLINRLRKLNGKKKIKFDGPLDGQDPDAIQDRIWQTYNAIQRLDSEGVFFFECSNTEFCEGGIQSTSISTSIDSFKSDADNLRTLALARNVGFEEALRKFLNKKLFRKFRKRFIDQGLSATEARNKARRKARNQSRNRASNQAAKYESSTDTIIDTCAGIVPNRDSAIAEINLYVNTYGTDRFQCDGANKVE